MTDAVSRFRQDYAPLLLRYLTQRDEAGLGAAYELGRGAVHDGLGLLDVVRVHADLVLEVLETVSDTVEAVELSRSASTLLLDLIASYDMSQRGYPDSWRAEARHAPDA